MAFEGHQGTMANTLFPIYSPQATMNVGCGNNGSVPFISIPSVSLQEPDTGSYVPWSHNAHDEPFEHINYTQNHIKKGKPSDVSDDGEIELQGLVSNILDEVDSQDSFYSEGSLSQRSNNIWSPKLLQDELLQYLQSDTKTQYNFDPNYTSHDAFGKTQGQAANKEFCQPLSNGFPTNQHIFILPNGLRDSFTQHGPQKPPPGLPLPDMANTCLSQLRQKNYDNMTVNEDKGNGEHMENLPNFSHVFRPQNDMNSADLFFEDHYNQRTDKPLTNDRYTSQDLNQLVSSFQSFVTGEQEPSKFTNVPIPAVRMHHEDYMDKWTNPSPFMQTQGNHSAQMQRQLDADFGTVQRDRARAPRKPLFKHDPLQNLSAFTLQNTECSLQPKLFMGNQQQNKMLLQIENTSLPLNMNQYSKHQIQQGPLKIKPQMQKEKKRMAGFLGHCVPTRPLTNSEILPEEKRPALSQSPFYDLPISTRPYRFGRENNNTVIAGNTQQFMPLIYPENDPRRHHSQLPNSNFTPRSSLAYGGCVPSMDMSDMVSANEIAEFNSGLNNIMSRRGENTYHGMASALTASVSMNQGGAVIQLYLYLDECYEQWRCLEKERKRVEIVLSKTILGKQTTAFPSSSLPKTPPNPTRVDHLIVNQMREQVRVSCLLDKMQCLSSVPLNANIYTALNKNHMAICVTSARRKEEITNMSHNQRQRDHFTEERDTKLLVIALKDLAATTRKLRTAMWCALQMTLPKPVKRLEQPVSEEKEAEKCPSPFEGYSYKL